MSKEALRKSIIALELLESHARRLLEEVETNGPLFAQQRVVMVQQARFVVDALEECRRAQHCVKADKPNLLRALKYLKMSNQHFEKSDAHYKLPPADSRLWAFRRCSECKTLLEERCVYCDVCGTDVPP